MPKKILIVKDEKDIQDLLQLRDYDYFGTTRTVDVHVAHLRQKFQTLNKSLISIKGLGYKLHEEPVKA